MHSSQQGTCSCENLVPLLVWQEVKLHADEAFLTCLPLTSCCTAGFLTDHGLQSVARGLGTPMVPRASPPCAMLAPAASVSPNSQLCLFTAPAQIPSLCWGLKTLSCQLAELGTGHTSFHSPLPHPVSCWNNFLSLPTVQCLENYPFITFCLVFHCSRWEGRAWAWNLTSAKHKRASFSLTYYFQLTKVCPDF